MTFFDIINYIFYKKKYSETDLSEETIQEFSPYMVTRWLSFYDKQQAILANEIFNKFSSIDENKHNMLNLYYNIISKLKFKKINYIKKKKQEKDNKIQTDIALIANNRHISIREIKSYIDFS